MHLPDPLAPVAVAPGQRVYFASDFHLGVPDEARSRERERKIIRWLEMARRDAAAIYLLGDVFDFWFEYRYAIPKGFTRLKGKLAELTDAGIAVRSSPAITTCGSSTTSRASWVSPWCAAR